MTKAERERCAVRGAIRLRTPAVGCPGRHDVLEAVSRTMRRFGIRGCADLVAQEFGDHPETAAARMRWVRQVIGESRPAAPVRPPTAPGAPPDR
jgi:hypothetical protein